MGSEQQESFGARLRWRLHQWTQPIHISHVCLDRRCRWHACSIARAEHDQIMRAQARERCRRMPGWDEKTWTFDGPDGRKRTSEQVYREMVG